VDVRPDVVVVMIFDSFLVLKNGSTKAFIDPKTALSTFPLHESLFVILKVDALLAYLGCCLDDLMSSRPPIPLLSAQQLADALTGRLNLGPAVVLPNIQELQLYPISSDGTNVQLTVGMRARPQIWASGNAPPTKTPQITPKPGPSPKPKARIRISLKVDDAGHISAEPSFAGLAN